MMKAGKIIALTCIAFCYSFSPTHNYLPFHITGFAQGTTYTITYYANRPLISIQQTDSLLNEIDQSLSIYKASSLISRFNSSPRGIRTDKHLRSVVTKALQISELTGGISDITIMPLVEAWGFGPSKSASLPDSVSIRTILGCVGFRYLTLTKDSLLKSKPCTRIDVNGIAQGYSADLLAKLLEQKGIGNYLVEIGGELRVKGRKPNNELMKIGIESPGYDPFAPNSLRKVVAVDHGAITTSGNYRKYRDNGSQKISHLIDPFTGYSFSNEMISVTVWANDGITADGLDNALMGMGLHKAMAFLQHHKNIQAYLIYEDRDGIVKDTATANFPSVMPLQSPHQ